LEREVDFLPRQPSTATLLQEGHNGRAGAAPAGAAPMTQDELELALPSCEKAGKAQNFKPIWGSSREGGRITMQREMIGVAALATCILVAIAPARAKSNVNVTAVSGIVTGNVQQVGFRAMIQKQAIQYNLAGSAENKDDGSVRFILQGDKNRINQAVAVIQEGTKKSSKVKVSVSQAGVDLNLNTFTVKGWTSVSRNIANPYALIFTLRSDNTTINKRKAKAVWLEICNRTVKGEDVGKCDKGDE
jgi:acylphosphatase